MANLFRKQVKESAVVLASQLREKSVNALATFHQVMEDLKSINAQASAKQVELAAEAAKIDLEIEDLAVVTASNDKVISNIEKILS